MATIINTPASTREDSGSGWAVAVIILLVVIAGLLYAYVHYRGGRAVAPTINVTVPAPTLPALPVAPAVSPAP